jgi:hypothetical protein
VLREILAKFGEMGRHRQSRLAEPVSELTVEAATPPLRPMTEAPP